MIEHMITCSMIMIIVLIINKVSQKSRIIKEVKKIKKKIFITIVKNHNFGPQYTVNKLKGA